MHLKWNNAFSKVFAASAAALMATNSLYAIPRGSPCDVKPEVVCCPDPAPGPFAFAFPFDPDINCPSDVYVYADFLAFQAKQEGMEFAILDENGATSPMTNGDVAGFSSDHRDWDYNFGARFGLGFYTDHDAWNIDMVWTWLNIRDYKKFNANSAGSYLVPLWELGTAMPDPDAYGQRSSAVWSANYNVLDVILGKPYYISRYTVFNPFFGVRGGWINQHFSVDYGGSLVATPGNRVIHHGDNDFWGVGLRTGIDTSWLITSGFSIFGRAAGSLLYGKFRIDQSVLQASAAGSGSGDGINLEDRHYMNVPNAEIAMGLAWGTHLSQNTYYLSFKLAYEFHVWFNQLNMRRFWAGTPAYPNDVVSRGNLTLNGFSFRAALDF